MSSFTNQIVSRALVTNQTCSVRYKRDNFLLSSRYLKMAFISRTAFAKKAELQKEANRVLTWKDLPVDGEIYKIEVVEEKSGKFGTCVIASIINARGEKKRFGHHQN